MREQQSNVCQKFYKTYKIKTLEKIKYQTFRSSRNSRDNNVILCRICVSKFSETSSLCPARSPISFNTFLNAVYDDNLKINIKN